MKNKESFLSKIKKKVIMENNCDEKIKALKKEKEISNEEIKRIIAENKVMFKKRRLSDLFTEKIVFFCFTLSFLIEIIMLFLGITNNLTTYTYTVPLLLFFFFFFFSGFFYATELPEGKKRKFLSKIKYLRKNKKQIMASLRSVDDEKENISKMINDFGNNNNDDNKKLFDFAVDIDLAKSIGSYFSESEVDKMMFDKNGSSITYYDILNFIYKMENIENIKTQARYIKEVANSEDIRIYG